jgi:predicted anti-sigma-YlaC factor YlaD
MTCDSFERRLDDLLDGRCTPEQWREAEAHLAGCPRCRRVFDAVSGRADDMDEVGHESLAQTIVARTSGGSCVAARERLCDFVDGALDLLDRDLVGGHLDHCPACAELAAALAETASVLPSFAALAPRASLVPGVLAATSRRPVQPTFGERVSAWLAHAAERPRFSLEVAYVLTVLLLVVLGNPVNAFKEASVRVQPRVSVVRAAVSGPIDRLRARGEEKLTSVERAIAPKAESAGSVAAGRALLWQWWQTYVDAPVRSLLSWASEWAARLADAVGKAMSGSASEPPPPAAR